MKIQLFIHLFDDSIRKYNVSNNITIKDLLKIIKKTNMIKNKIKIKNATQLLKNDLTLLEHNIKNNDTLYLYTPINGGFIDLLIDLVTGMANLFKNCSIDAIDISTSSLGYASNKSDEFKVNNINFIKKDILDLEDLNSNYNYIECSGVLHHMNNPKDGLNILCKLLKKNGIMKLGLYSSKARTNINKARKYIKKNKIQFSEENLKEFRKAVITDKLSHSKFKGLENIPDFYSTSNSRDLLFHVQEKQFNLHIIKKLLNNYNLNFAGFDFSNQYTLPDFKKYFPISESEFCLKNWDIYEQNNNSTFIGMYNFFVTK